MKSQRELVLKHLKQGVSMTPHYALRMLSVERLAPRILELKQAGERIESKFVTVQNQFGQPCRVKMYWLVRQQ